MIGPMKKKVLTSVVITIVIMTLLFGGVGAALYLKMNNTIKELEIKKADSKAYILTRDMNAGEVVSANDIELVEVKSESAATDSFGEKDDVYSMIGKRLRVNAAEKTILTKSLFYDEEKDPTLDTRLQEFNMITLPSDLDEGDYIDVRIRFPNGEDYSVVVGKMVEGFGATDTNNTVFLRLNEEEIVRMGSAIIESYVNTGVNLYANKYVDPTSQLFEYKKVDLVEAYENNKTYMVSGDLEPNLSGEMVPKQIEVQRTEEEIAKILNISKSDVVAIAKAIEEKDDETLDLYRDKTVRYEKSIIANYPVKPEVQTLILNNPNILEEIKVKYDETIAMLQEKRKNFLDTSLTQTDILTGEVTPNEEHVNNIKERLDAEIESQRTERQEYLLKLIQSQNTATTTTDESAN